MNDLTVFQNPEFGELRTAEHNGETWFCLADICRPLGIVSQDVRERLKKDRVVTIHHTDKLGRPKDMLFVDESNLYRALFQSRKPEAERFTDWVTEEVLPSIRKTGRYENRPMTVAENLKIGAFLRTDKGGIADDMDYVHSLFPRLKERSWQLAGTLSGGEQQMLAVGRALMSRPKVLMMDEPSLGLAPLIVKDIFSIIRRVNADGITVLLIEQNANAALRVADYGYVLETGTIALTGTGEELLRNESVREAYLGKKK